MILSPSLRRLVLATHLAVSIGWLGAIAAYLPLDVAAATSDDEATLRAAYLAMDLIARTAIVPLAVAALVTGVVISLGTRWGLIRHWWTLISLVLTTIATIVLFVETRVIGAMAASAADPTTPAEALRGLGNTLPHSIGGMVVLGLVLVLNVYKPRGLTRYGWRKLQQERRAALLRSSEDGPSLLTS